MAISNNITQSDSEYGIAFDGAYFRIVTAAISRQRAPEPKFSVMIDLSAYGTNSPTDDTREVLFRRYHAPLTEIEAASGDTFMAQCYTWVMAQADMSGSKAA